MTYAEPPWAHLPPAEPYPYSDTHDPDSGPKPHPAIRDLVPYLGFWRGRGRGGYPTIEDFDYAQEVRISHDGRPFVAYESWSWVLDEHSRPVRPAARESGWWRPVLTSDGEPTGELEALFTSPTGIMELHIGHIKGGTVELATDAVVRTPTAKEVTAGHRLYGIVQGALMYAQEMAAVGHPLTPHLSARLTRVTES
ncbi:MAG TPA: FABP family protein [Natronosporangium sp.]|jgi:hypothetical protein|nr:FABP family protein [Natronosporangium sp.]